jgi:hypothetical protein
MTGDVCRTYGALGLSLVPFPTLPGWANVCRAYGAPDEVASLRMRRLRSLASRIEEGGRV